MNKAEVENRGLDQDIFDVLCNALEKQHFRQTLGLEVIYLGKGIAGIKMIPDPKYSSPGGRVHGGILATMADTVMGVAAITINRQLYRTLDIDLTYLAPAFEETEITAEACVVHQGNTIALVEASLFNDKGKLITKGKGTFIRDITVNSIEE